MKESGVYGPPTAKGLQDSAHGQPRVSNLSFIHVPKERWKLWKTLDGAKEHRLEDVLSVCKCFFMQIICN
jgi:hypothetical protein